MKTGRKGTTFDDVFRTIASKMPWMMVSLINEVFGENYPENVAVTQLRNEFVSESGKIITDSIFMICGKYYHIECQSNPDSTMEIRMVEYDFAIAHEHASKEDGKYVIRFPESAVLYLRHNSNTPDVLTVKVEMPDGQQVEYATKAIKAQNYTKDELFQKKLLALVPFYLMRFEDRFSEMEQDSDEQKQFLEECEDLRARVADEVGDKETLYNDLINLTMKVSDHILAGYPKIKKGARRTMGGRILTLNSEKLLKKGRKEGLKEGVSESIEKLANHYLSIGTAKTKDEAMKMASAILK